MPKKSLTLRDFTKGINTESSPSDIDDKNLARSVGVTIERPGVLRPLGKANSISGNGVYYRFLDDNDNNVAIAGLQDPGHGLYAFSHAFNFGERSAITGVTSTYTVATDVTYVNIPDELIAGAGARPFVDFSVGDIVRIYGKTASKELNNRYFKVSKIDTTNKRVYIKVIIDGSDKEFSLTDEAGNRVAAAVIDTGATAGEAIDASATAFDCSSRQLFAKGDYIKLGTDDEVMKITGVDLDSSTDAISIERNISGGAEEHYNGDAIHKYVHGVDHADLTAGTEDGYIEIVPQRNFTKYIACQHGETIKIFFNDTTNDREHTTNIYDNVIDLKDDFQGAGGYYDDETTMFSQWITDANALGLDTLSNLDSTDWPNKGVMPTFLFAADALRVSPSNKIGRDDENYSPRWLGHINRSGMFGRNDSTTKINEWYLDTIAPKRPVEQGSSHSTNERERYNLGVNNDYSKNNTLGMPWGNNWFAQFYLTGDNNQRQNPAIARIQECDFWENDTSDDIEDEIENDTYEYEISGGIADGFGRFGWRWNWKDSTDTVAEYWKIRQNLYKRNWRELTTLTEAIDAGEADWSVVSTSGMYVGQYLKVGSEIVQVYEVTSSTVIKVYKGQEGTTDTSHSSSDKIYDASDVNYTRPTATGDLLINNGGGGQGGAYTFCSAIVNSPTNGEVPWAGLSGYIHSKHQGKQVITLSYTGSNGAITDNTVNGHPDIVSTKADESLDGTNWVMYQGAAIPGGDQDICDLRHYSVAKDVLKPGQTYYVTYTCRNFYSTGDGRLKMMIGQTDTSTAGEYHIIDSNAYKTTVQITAPSDISDANRNLVLCIKVDDTGADGDDVNAQIGGDHVSRRTMIGDLSVIPKNKMRMTTTDAIENSTKTFKTFNGYSYPLSSLSIGYQKISLDTGVDTWGANSSAYNFYVTYLYDGGQTPQESAPRFLQKINVSENVEQGTSHGFRFSVSLCYSSLGDIYDMWNKRIMGARVYFREAESQEDEKLFALLDIDFVRGVRKATNADFVPWAEDFQNATEKATDASIDGTYSHVSYNTSRPYKQVKPADESSHEHGYFQFDSPPIALNYSTLNSSQPFEKGGFFAQYKTITILKGKAYIGNFSIRPTGLTNTNKNSKLFEYYPSSIVASEEGCYDKFAFDSLWINVPELNDDTPIVKLESYQDSLIVHKENSTFILDFKEEAKPVLVASFKAGGIKWPSQSISTGVGVFWVNKYGCFNFNGKEVSDLIRGRISKNSLGWPNNNSNLYYWDIDASNKKIPSLGFDEINSQLLVSYNCRLSGESNTFTNQKDSNVWIYDVKTGSWTGDTCKLGPTTEAQRFLRPLNQGGTSWRTNFVSEAGDNVVFIHNHLGAVSTGTKYDITKWNNKLYTYTTSDGTLKGDKRFFEMMTKELDFGNPHTKKRIYQIFITYRMTFVSGDIQDGAVDTDINYGTDGGALSETFDTDVSDGFASSFSNTNGLWSVATLVPSSSIDCYKFQLKISSEVSDIEKVLPYDFEINDITFVYREKKIKTRVKS